jgi:hypothetical protein
MDHIKKVLQNAKDNVLANRAKYYHNNFSIFVRYFDSEQQYIALINAGNFKKIEEIIKNKTNFNFNEFSSKFNNN